MKRTLERVRTTFELEFDISFPFPILECLFTIPLLLTSSIALQVIFGDYANSELFPDFFNSEKLIRNMSRVGALVFAWGLNSLNYVILFIVPMIVTFNLARSFENGTMRTLLSYPIGRRGLILTKVSQVVVLVGLAVNGSLLFSVYAFIPIVSDVPALLVMSLSIWVLVFTVATTSVLIAVASKSTPVTAILGCGLWFFFLIEAMGGNMSAVARGIMNPVVMAVCLEGEGAIYQLFTDITLGDLMTSMIGTLAIGVLALLVSLALFDRREV